MVSQLHGRGVRCPQFQTFFEGLLAGKLLQAIANQAPEPTGAELNAYLAKQAKPNAIVRIPIRFTNASQAKKTFDELQRLKLSQTLDQFTTTFDSYTWRIGAKASTEFVHETFDYNNRNELPDFARDAVQHQEGDLGLFQRGDGSAVIYLILKQVMTDADMNRASAIQTLRTQMQNQFVEDQVKQLVQQADVQIFYGRLPPDAQPN